MLLQSLSPVIDLLYPPRCPLCGEAIAAQTGLCRDCWEKLVIPGEPCCKICQLPFADTQLPPGNACSHCLASPPRHDGIAAATLYNDTARQLVLALKHGGKIALAPMLARQIAARLPDLKGEWVTVPVPLHPIRLWRRGFNQSALLARELSELTGARLLVDGLKRTRRTPSLGGLGRIERRRVLHGAIVTKGQRLPQIEGAQILLVDDVMTSGATSDACIAALKQAGARRVVIACFSRKLDESL